MHAGPMRTASSLRRAVILVCLVSSLRSVKTDIELLGGEKGGGGVDGWEVDDEEDEHCPCQNDRCMKTGSLLVFSLFLLIVDLADPKHARG